MTCLHQEHTETLTQNFMLTLVTRVLRPFYRHTLTCIGGAKHCRLIRTVISYMYFYIFLAADPIQQTKDPFTHLIGFLITCWQCIHEHPNLKPPRLSVTQHSSSTQTSFITVVRNNQKYNQFMNLLSKS